MPVSPASQGLGDLQEAAEVVDAVVAEAVDAVVGAAGARKDKSISRQGELITK